MGKDSTNGPARADKGVDAGADFAATIQTLPPDSATQWDGLVPGDSSLDSALTADPTNPGTDDARDSRPDAAAEAITEAGALSEHPTLSHIGRYALKRLLGEGGLGRVYEAWDPLLSRAVAVKTLQFDLDMPSRIALDRLLLNEARAAANLNHTHIVTVFDAGLSAHGVYIAMERLHGKDLRQALAGGWRPSVAQAAQIVRRVADAIAYAHAHGVVHCDLKPANIFLTRRGRPKVLDFGIARAAKANAAALPLGPPGAEGGVAGSPHYLAPEQWARGEVDARTDIHALGAVLYELLTGRKAFGGDSLDAIQAAVRDGPPPPSPHEIAAGVPSALSAIVMKALARDPADRFQGAADLAIALRPFGRGADAEGLHAAADAPGSAAPPTPTRRGWLVGAAALAGLAGIALWLGRPQPPAGIAAAASAAPAASAPPTPAPPPAMQEAATAAPAPTPASAPTPIAPVAAAPAPAPKPAKPAATAAQRPAAGATTGTAVASAPAAEPQLGSVQIAVSPWGQVEVNGKDAGTTPPLSRLSLPEGQHQITIRNSDFPPFTATVEVRADRPATVRHRFGS